MFSESLGKASIDIRASTKKFGGDLNKAQSSLKKSLTSMRGMIVGTLGATAFLAASRSALQFADSIDKMSKAFGISSREFQKLQFASEQFGVGLSGLEQSFRALNRQLLDASKGEGRVAEVFDELGVSLNNANGEMKASNVIFNEVLVALEQVDNKSRRAALAQRIFTSAHMSVLKIVAQGTEQFQALQEEAEKFGLVLEDDAVASLVKLQDNLGKVSLAMKVGFAGALAEMAEGLSDEAFNGFIDFLRMASKLIVGIVNGIGMLSNRVQEFGQHIGEMAERHESPFTRARREAEERRVTGRTYNKQEREIVDNFLSPASSSAASPQQQQKVVDKSFQEAIKHGFEDKETQQAFKKMYTVSLKDPELVNANTQMFDQGISQIDFFAAGEDMGQGLENALKDFLNQFLNGLFTKLEQQLFGSGGMGGMGGGGGGGGIGGLGGLLAEKLFGGLFGGGSSSSGFDFVSPSLDGMSFGLSSGGISETFSDGFSVGGIPGFAKGGRPNLNKPSIVGERGPELFVPDQAGTVIPNDQISGRGGVTQVINVSPGLPETVRKEIIASTPYIEQVARSAIFDLKSRGEIN